MKSSQQHCAGISESRFFKNRMEQHLNEISKTLGGMPVPALTALIILAGFALAAYAIYAVMKISRGKRRD